MASVSFYIRSKKKEGKIFLRLRATNIDVRTATKLSIKPEDWDKKKAKAKPRFNSINKYLNDLENEILTKFHSNLNIDNWKKWLDEIINPNNPLLNKIEYPDNLYDFIPIYINLNINHFKKATVTKFNTIRTLIKKYSLYSNIKHLKFSDLDHDFLINFKAFSSNVEKYNMSYTLKNLKLIKMIAKTAAGLGIQVNQSVAAWSLSDKNINTNNIKPITLNFEELDLIENHIQPSESLENIKDWLLIACYTGQRASDFLKFNHNQIIESTDTRYIEYKQTKTGHLMRTPILNTIEKILEKRQGKFPKTISSQKFNQYVKIVAKNAGINQITLGKKAINKRVVIGHYPKYELITSHIGRRSFATNFYNNIPTSILMTATGHKSEKEFLNYIGKSDKEKSEILASKLKELGFL